jgi:hypothetical protein
VLLKLLVRCLVRFACSEVDRQYGLKLTHATVGTVDMGGELTHALTHAT